MTEKEIQKRLEREEAEENSEKEVSKSLTVNDILDKLEEEIIDDNDNKSVQITLFPPNCDVIDSQSSRLRETRSEARRELRRPRALRLREPRSEGRRELRRPRTLEEALMMTVLCYQQVEVVTRMF